jgi:hypothetical protein
MDRSGTKLETATASQPTVYVSISAAITLHDQFAHDFPAVRAFFDALVKLLTGGGRKQWRRNQAA